MSDPTAPAAPPPAAPTMQPQQPAKSAPPWTINQRIAKWLPICAGIVVAIAGAAKIADNFTLPSCDSSRSLGAIKSIFEDKKLPEPTLTGVSGISNSSSEKTCQASYEIPNENGTLDYKVFWDGWEPKVMITKVNN
jgi:hypothetical protein